MKFLHRPVHDFEGITRNFEQLETIFTGLNAVRFGAATIPASGTPDASVTVTHGLPQTPVVVLATLDNSAFCGLVFSGSVGATTFVLTARLVSGANVTGDSLTYWLAIG